MLVQKLFFLTNLFKCVSIKNFMSFKKSAYIFSLLNLLVLPFGFVIRIFYSQTLTIDDFGFLYAVIAFFSFITIFTKLGLEQSLLYFFPKYISKNDKLSQKNSFYSVFLLVFAVNLLLAILLYFFSSFLEVHYFRYDGATFFISVFFLYFFLNDFITLVTSVFLSYNKIFLSQIFYALRLLFTFLFSLFFFLGGFEPLPEYYAFSWTFSFLLFGLLNFGIFFKMFPFFLEKPTFSFSLLKEFLHYGFFGLFTGAGTMIIAQIDLLLLTGFFSVSDVGLYSNAVSVISIFFLLLSPLSLLFLPLFSRYKEEGNYELMKTLMHLLYVIGFYLLLPFSLLFYLYSDTLLMLVFSAPFVAAAPYLKLFALFSIFRVLYEYNVNIMKGLGLIRETSVIITGVALANFFFDLLALQFFGILGIALVTGLCWLALFFLTFVSLYKRIAFNIKFFSFFLTCFLAYVFLLFVDFLKLIVRTGFYLLDILFIFFIAFFFYLLAGYFLKIYTFKQLSLLVPDPFLKTYQRLCAFFRLK